MQKISIEVLENAIRAGLTSAEVDMLLYIARFQNEAGIARGIYYKDVCEEIKISYQAFYDCKKSLEAKGIIYTEKNNYFDWDITILNNSFIGKENYGRGYVSVATKMIRTEVFRKFKANTKLMALYLLREWKISFKNTKKTSYQILKENFFEKFKKLFSVTDRMLRKYLGQLKPFLNVYLENGRKYYLTFNQNAVRDHGEKTGNEEGREHEVKIACRRNKVKEVSDKTKADVLTLMSQFYPKIKKHTDFDLSEILSLSLLLMNRNKKRKDWDRTVNPALLNKLMQTKLL